jgi:hypothetical protein
MDRTRQFGYFHLQAQPLELPELPVPAELNQSPRDR